MEPSGRLVRGSPNVEARHWTADVMVPIPLNRIRRRERGFNQAELLSKRLAKRHKLPHLGHFMGEKTAPSG
jgi:predicted amidophosphoribosyltransferase